MTSKQILLNVLFVTYTVYSETAEISYKKKLQSAADKIYQAIVFNFNRLGFYCEEFYFFLNFSFNMFTKGEFYTLFEKPFFVFKSRLSYGSSSLILLKFENSGKSEEIIRHIAFDVLEVFKYYYKAIIYSNLPFFYNILLLYMFLIFAGV